ncbi:MAG: O-antigen ligase family protein [Terriglobales bacterium]
MATGPPSTWAAASLWTSAPWAQDSWRGISRRRWEWAAAAVLGVLAGGLAACGWTWAGLGLVAAVALAWAGAHLAWSSIQTVLLAALLFVPDAVSGKTLGLRVTWSAGLTWTNFVVPGLALPLLAGAFWKGQKLWPERFPGLARWMLALLAWSLLVLAVTSLESGVSLLSPTGLLSILAHAFKLALFIVIGVALASGGASWRRGAERLLLWGIALNAAVGLAQVGGWVAALSPLAQGSHPRATGLLYDANLYAVCTSWALLWLLCQPPQPGRRRWAYWALTLAVAGSLVGAGSRAGFLACLAGGCVLWFCGHRRAVGRAALLLILMTLLFPARTWHRIRSAADTYAHSSAGAPIAAADTSTLSRLDSMGEAVLQIGRHPLLGLGFGRALYLGVPAVAPGPVAPPILFRGAQDMYLTVEAAAGPLGLLLLLFAIAAPFRLLNRGQRYAAAAVLAGYAGVLTACLTQEALWNARLLAVVVMLTASIGIGWRRETE